MSLRQMSPGCWVLTGAWGLLVGSYTLAALTVPNGRGLTAFGDIVQCAVALFACAGLFLNSFSREKRTRVFWLLLGLGCAAWLVGQSIWTYFEVVLRKDVPNPFIGDVILFLHPVPMIGALALKPHDKRDDLNVHIGYLDFSLLLVWWVYLYLFVVIPWQYIAPNVLAYGWSYDHLAAIENLSLAIGFAVLITRARGAWKEVYAHLFSASLLYAAGSYITNRAIDRMDYYTGSPFDLPLVASFVWFGTAGIMAYRLKPPREVSASRGGGSKIWAARLAMTAVFSIPLMALWSLWSTHYSPDVRMFRIAVTQVTLMLAALLIAMRQRLVDHDRIRLLEESHQSFENLKHFQAQMVQTEKLALDLNQVIASALHLSNLDLRGKHIQVQTDADPELPPILGDANQVLQVFFNLISNAVDALEEVGGGNLVIRTSHADGKLFIEFSDTGPGIKSPQQVFDPFFTTKPVGKGTGLGLSICYGIVQEHGGRIECFNRPEGGATFVVEFPVTALNNYLSDAPLATTSQSS